MIEIVLRKDVADAAHFDPKAPVEKRAQILRGNTLAVDAVNSIVHGYLRIAAIRGGLDPETDIRVSPMQPNSMLAAFQSKTIDGFAMSQPWTLIPVTEGAATTIVSSPNGDLPELVPFGYNLLVTRPDVCEKRRNICVAMGKVFTEAVAYIHSHPNETSDILAKKLGQIDPKVLKAAIAITTSAVPSPPVINKADLENAEIYNVEFKLMKPEEKLSSYDGLFTNQFVH